ncbi:ead/Ea22-like family protein [Escherichia coli]|nr:ead/Ea22-like family protein [Escherichia coli]
MTGVFVCQKWKGEPGGVIAECHVNCLVETDVQAYANAEFIAAFNPNVALALLDEIKRQEDSNIDAMCQIAELESNRAALAAEHGIQIAINELLALAPRLDKRAVDALSVAVEHLCKLIKKEATSERN